MGWAARAPRALAIVALCAATLLVVLVVLVVAFLLRNSIDVVIGLAGLLLCVVGGWWSVAERSRRRLVGFAGLAVGATLIVVAVLRVGQESWASVVGLSLALVLLAVAIAAVRAALAARLRALAPAPAFGSRRPSIRSCSVTRARSGARLNAPTSMGS